LHPTGIIFAQADGYYAAEHLPEDLFKGRPSEPRRLWTFKREWHNWRSAIIAVLSKCRWNREETANAWASACLHWEEK